MKRKLSWLLLGIVLLLGIAATINIETSNLYIQNSDTDTVKIRVRTAATQTAPWMEFNNNGTLAFSLPATGIIPSAYLNLKAGTNIFSDDSTVTQAFTTAFTSAPYVSLTRFVVGTITNPVLVSVSTTNFVAWGQTNAPFHWVAVLP